MAIPEFVFHDPVSLDEACNFMIDLGMSAVPLAGGTDVLVNMKKRLVHPDHVVSLGRIDSLRRIRLSATTAFIGATVTVADLAESTVIERNLRALKDAALALGSPLIRNLATIGGNICSARPAADLVPSLVVYGARLLLKKGSAERMLPLEEFFRGPGITTIESEEILIEIQVDLPGPDSGAAYLNLGVRKAHEINLVNVASFVSLKPHGPIAAGRIALGSVGPTVLRAPKAEAMLQGEMPSPALFAAAAESVAQECKPINDFRGSAEYRRAMVGVLTKRTLEAAYRQAAGIISEGNA